MLHPERYSLPAKVIAYLSVGFNYGHQAVLFFFVLSGFVIHLRYARSLQQDGTSARFDTLPFLFRRLRRIYPAFVMAVILTFCLDQIGITQQWPIYFKQTPYPLINLNMNPDYSLDNALRTLLFLEVPYTPSWGINGPLWSLKIEWWFYLLYPLFWWLTRRSLGLATGALAILFGLSFVSGLSVLPLLPLQSVFQWMLVWWMGALLGEIVAGRLAIPVRRVALLCGLFVILPFLVSPIVELPTGLQDMVWGLGFMGLLAACLTLDPQTRLLQMLTRFKPLGDMSYTLYVSHFPILTLLGGWLMTQSAGRTLPQHFGWIVWGTLLCLAFAYAAHFVVEKPFMSRRISTNIRST